jgi:AhpD family alkylhydroperoxidase
MLGGLLGRIDGAAQRAGAFGRIRYIKPVSYAESVGDVREVYDQILEEYGLGGPYFVTSVSPPLLAATWGLLRTSLLSSPLPRKSSEIIAAAVVQAEACPFCVDVHSELASGGGERDTATLVSRGDWDAMAARATECDLLALWARDFVHGNAAAPPVDTKQAPYAISVALLFVHVTSLVTIFQSDGLVAGFGGSKLIDRVTKAYMRNSLAKRMYMKRLSSDVSPGPTFDGALFKGYTFARDEPNLARALSRLDHAAAAVGAKVLSPEAQDVIGATLSARHTGSTLLDLRFIDDAVAPLPDEEHGAARLALLAGIAPYRILKPDLDAAGPGGERGERWVALAAFGARGRLHALAPSVGLTQR